ncbi:MAG: DUF2480 family protein [Bacteroidota bacterium]
MAEEIINRVAQSKLKVIDLEDYYPLGQRINLDIKDWLLEGLVLREKDFRAHVKNHDWEQYQDKYVAVFCSTEAIIPDWAFMLVTSMLQPFVKMSVAGNADLLETLLYQKIIDVLDISEYENLPVIIKGCSQKPVPLNALNGLTSKLIPVAKSIMYGEACSAVPLYKRK